MPTRRSRFGDFASLAARVRPSGRAAPFGGTCALETLAEGFQFTRLETRTKESNMYASRWGAPPRGARNLTGGRLPFTGGRTFDQP
eukprot:scaffold52_cov526-Pavlova_lutheri.AAC.1